MFQNLLLHITTCTEEYSHVASQEEFTTPIATVMKYQEFHRLTLFAHLMQPILLQSSF